MNNFEKKISAVLLSLIAAGLTSLSLLFVFIPAFIAFFLHKLYKIKNINGKTHDDVNREMSVDLIFVSILALLSLNVSKTLVFPSDAHYFAIITFCTSYYVIAYRCAINIYDTNFSNIKWVLSIAVGVLALFLAYIANHNMFHAMDLLKNPGWGEGDERIKVNIISSFLFYVGLIPTTGMLLAVMLFYTKVLVMRHFRLA